MEPNTAKDVSAKAKKPTPEEKIALNAKLKETYDKNDAIFFVETSTKMSEITEADEAGKKLMFDIIDFPDLSAVVLGKLSRDNKMAYQQDARVAHKASIRMDEGKSPYTSMRDKLVQQDPLHLAGSVGRTGRVEGGNPNMHYLAAEPRNVERMKRAGYQMVKPGEEAVTNGVEKGERVVLMGDNGKVENVMMKVSKEDYTKHVEIQGQISQARLGENMDVTKERLGKYSSKVNIYNDSNFDNIRPQKG